MNIEEMTTLTKCIMLLRENKILPADILASNFATMVEQSLHCIMFLVPKGDKKNNSNNNKMVI